MSKAEPIKNQKNEVKKINYEDFKNTYNEFNDIYQFLVKCINHTAKEKEALKDNNKYKLFFSIDKALKQDDKLSPKYDAIFQLCTKYINKQLNTFDGSSDNITAEFFYTIRDSIDKNGSFKIDCDIDNDNQILKNIYKRGNSKEITKEMEGYNGKRGIKNLLFMQSFIEELQETMDKLTKTSQEIALQYLSNEEKKNKIMIPNSVKGIIAKFVPIIEPKNLDNGAAR